jgi:signal transduction histidine kinase
MSHLRAIRTQLGTVRSRLTLLYGAVFLLSGLVLLTVGYFLVRANLERRGHLQRQLALSGIHMHLSPAQQVVYEGLRAQLIHQTLSDLVLVYVLALSAMTVVSVLAGWILAGRALAPLREITATAQRVSGENLGERIALNGPEDELKQLADTFDGMLGRLDAAFASQNHFVANASHELRTPLAIMRTELEVALADPEASAAELREMGEALKESIDRSEGLISALLALARSETVTLTEPVALDVLAGDCVTDLSRRAANAEVTIDTAGLTPGVVTGQPELLERMLFNLIDNGIRHNVPGGRLSLATVTNGQTVELMVANGGPVIAPEQVQSLTQPFRRLSRHTAGFGLGLSIVASVIKAHGGALSVTAPPTGGLEVRVELSGAVADPASRPGRGRAVSGRS